MTTAPTHHDGLQSIALLSQTGGAVTPFNDLSWMIVLVLLAFLSAYMLTRYGTPAAWRFVLRQEAIYDRVLVNQLLLDLNPRTAVFASVGLVMFVAIIFGLYLESFVAFFFGAAVGLIFPNLIIRHLADKRATKLELQLVDGITTLASGVRAGLTLVQAMELLVQNQTGPIKQEFAQLLREYSMGMDLNQAMRSTANRIGSPNYRLLFTAIEMHRKRGGDTGESLDRISESIREIQRLEGKLDAITAQGRIQAWMMAVAPIFIVGIYWVIDSEGVESLFVQPEGRFLLLGAFGLVLLGFLWIRRIMSVDI